MDKSQYAAVSGGTNGTRWEIKAEEKNGYSYTKDSPNNVKEGFFIKEADIPGKEGKTFKVFSIQTLTKEGLLGEVFDIKGDTVLNGCMEKIPMKSFIGIEYQGREFKKEYKNNPQIKSWTQTNSYHNWFVGVNTSAPKYDEVAAKSAAAGVKTAPIAEKRGGMEPNTNFTNQAAPVDESDLPF